MTDIPLLIFHNCKTILHTFLEDGNQNSKDLFLKARIKLQTKKKVKKLFQYSNSNH